MADPFTIRIFVPDGDPEGVLIIDRMNWTGLVLVFPRAKWPDIRKRPEMLRTGVYVLDGYKSDEDDLPTIYVGQADSVGGRIQSHFTKKDFWDRGVVFVSSTDGLNRAPCDLAGARLDQKGGRSEALPPRQRQCATGTGTQRSGKGGHAGIFKRDSTNPAARPLTGF